MALRCARRRTSAVGTSPISGQPRHKGRTVEVVEVRLLGQLEAVEGGAVLPVRGAKQRALLTILALQRGQPVSADRLIDVLWGDGEAANPTNALQAQIGQLRRTLGPTAIVTSEAGYALGIGPDDLDAARFEQLVAEGRRLLAEGETVLASSVLGEALRLRRGEPLAEFAYADFANGERAHLEELTLVAIEARAETDLALGRHGELVDELETLCRQHPLREHLWELLILALYRAGRQAEALRAYSDARAHLIDELGLEPGPALRELEARVLAQDPSLALASPAPVREATSPRAAGNLRAPMGRFIGRGTEIEQVCEAVRACRLVTLTGPGGAGKTRLAVEAAAVLAEEHRDGAWLVELAGVTDPAGVAAAAAAALGASPSVPGWPLLPGSPSEVVAKQLAGRSLVVVIDNCEQVIDAAAALADALVGEVPGLRLITTSREALGVPGEVLVPVGALPLAAAVELFIDHARAVRPGFAPDDRTTPLVEDICRRLDGLPLAVELAAARLRALTVATVAERLHDRFRLLTRGARTAPPRQRTLRAVVDWSYELLFEDERRLFARLSVFVGGCELTAVEAVCADDRVPTGEVFDVMSRLVDKSLVTAPVGDDARFTQLQTLWEYGRDRLEESHEADAVRANHAAYYLQMAVEAYQRLRGNTGPAWRDRLSSESRNLKAALDWYIAAGDPDAALSLASGIAWLWFIDGNFAEGARWLGDALRAEGERRPQVAATAKAWHGYCLGMSSGPAAGVLECEEAVAALRPAADPLRLAEALELWAAVLAFSNHFDQSLQALHEAKELLDKLENGWLLATHDLVVAWVLLYLGRLDDAEPAARSSLERFDLEGEVLLVVSPLNVLARIAEARGDLHGASVAYEAVIERCRATGQALEVPFILVALAALRARQGDDNAADGLYAEAIACCFNPWLSSDAMVGQAAVARRLGDLVRARSLLDEAGRHYPYVDFHAGPPRVLAGLAWWALASGQPDDAAVFAARAAQGASASGDPATLALAETAVAAVQATVQPTPDNIGTIAALATRRAQATAYGSLTDGPDLAALAARLDVTSS